MPRAGLTRAAVVEAAGALADEGGLEALSLVDLAERLGIRKPSLYNHVAGIGDLRRELALVGLRELGRSLSRAAAGKAVRGGMPCGPPYVTPVWPLALPSGHRLSRAV